MKRILLLLSLSSLLALPIGCGDNEGEPCNVDSDCDGSLVCGQLTVCSVPGTCAGICADPCDVDEDCPEGGFCFTEPGGARTWCRID